MFENVSLVILTENRSNDSKQSEAEQCPCKILAGPCDKPFASEDKMSNGYASGIENCQPFVSSSITERLRW